MSGGMKFGDDNMFPYPISDEDLDEYVKVRKAKNAYAFADAMMARRKRREERMEAEHITQCRVCKKEIKPGDNLYATGDGYPNFPKCHELCVITCDNVTLFELMRIGRPKPNKHGFIYYDPDKEKEEK